MATYQRPDQLNLLVVVAHPHDFTHMAGTCAHHIEDGDQVTVVSITGGGKTHNEKLFDELRKPADQQDMSVVTQSAEQYVNEKVEQFRKVCALFGVTDCRVLPFSDVPLTGCDEMYQTLAQIIREVRPHILIAHSPGHPVDMTRTQMDDDHVEAGKATRMGVRLANAPDQNNRQAPHAIATTYYMGAEYAITDLDLIVDITDQIEKRYQAEILFTTQGHTEEFARKLMEVMSSFGWAARTGYGEAFVRAGRQVSRKLLVTDEDLEEREMSREQMMARLSQRFR